MTLPAGAVTPAMKADDRLLHIFLTPIAASTPRQDRRSRSIMITRVGVGIVVEHAHHVDVRDAVDRITTDTDSGGPPQADLGELCDCLVGQGAGARNHADATPSCGMWPGMMPILISSGVMGPGQLGPSSRVFLATGRNLGLHLVAHFEHVANRDAFGDADRQIEVSLAGLQIGGGTCRRHVDDRNGRAGVGGGFL